MRRCLLNAIFAVAAVTLSAPALAQEARGSCPPGAWFCEEVAPPAASQEEAADVDEEAAPPPRFATPPPRHHVHRHAQPPVVVYRPHHGPPPQVVIVAPGAAAPKPVRVQVQAVEAPERPAKPRRWHRRWGLNLRVEGAAIGGGGEHGGAEDAGMGGLGLSLRFRPVPAFAFDLGVDVLSGTDWNGFKRTEMPISLSGMLFVNPKSRVQFYFLGGAHFAHAEVEANEYDPLRDWSSEDGMSTEYSYFGGQGGIGLEFRISRLVALNIDALAFVRKRTDDGGPPEFTDPVTGRSTNTSGGGLFRGGLTFWW